MASFAYKIIMNSFYGVLATGSCRFAADELAGAITEFGHYILRWAQGRLEERGVRVIYGDTDSVFVDPGLAEDCPAAEARALGERLCAEVDQALAEHIEKEYGVESRLELEFEKYYARFLLPPMRGSEKGRAKGYAGLRVSGEGEQLDIVGMEAVRRDWTRLAHQLQRQLLELLFHDAGPEAIEQCAMEWVRALPEGPRRQSATRAAFVSWMKNDEPAAEAWLLAQELSPFHDPALNYYARELAKTDSVRSLALCEQVQDEKRRMGCLKKAAKNWYRVDALAAEGWLQESPLDEETRSQVRHADQRTEAKEGGGAERQAPADAPPQEPLVRGLRPRQGVPASRAAARPKTNGFRAGRFRGPRHCGDRRKSLARRSGR